MSEFKEYAEFNGIDPKKAGEVVLAAIEGNAISDDLEATEFEQYPGKFGVKEDLGIRPDDSKEEIAIKIRSALDKIRIVAKKMNFPLDSADYHLAEGAEHLTEILDWIKK